MDMERNVEGNFVFKQSIGTVRIGSYCLEERVWDWHAGCAATSSFDEESSASRSHFRHAPLKPRDHVRSMRPQVMVNPVSVAQPSTAHVTAS
jgi:hypothetical protein